MRAQRPLQEGRHGGPPSICSPMLTMCATIGGETAFSHSGVAIGIPLVHVPTHVDERLLDDPVTAVQSPWTNCHDVRG